MKFSIQFKYSNVTFKNKETKETISFETKAQDGNTFIFDNVDEDVVIGILKGVKDKKASSVFGYEDFRTNFINAMARNKCKELYDKMDKEGWKVEDIVVSGITLKDLEFTKPTMNARENITVESTINKEENKMKKTIESSHEIIGTCEECGRKNKKLHRMDDDRLLCGYCADEYENMQRANKENSRFWKYYSYDPSLEEQGLSEESNEENKMEQVDVIFKKDRRNGGEIIAFFPDTMYDGSCNPGNLMSYAHMGQHSEASIDYYNMCRPATEEEYAPLLHELEQIYDDCELHVVRKATKKHRNRGMEIRKQNKLSSHLKW